MRRCVSEGRGQGTTSQGRMPEPERYLRENRKQVGALE